jgi:hypothetical protein
VPVMHLIVFRRLAAGPLNHDDGALPLSQPPRCSIVVVAPARHRPGTGPGLVTGDTGAAGEAGEAYNCRPAARRAGVPAARLRRKSP